MAGTKTFALKIATAVKLLRKATLSEKKTITVIKINVYALSIYLFSIRICLTRCLEFHWSYQNRLVVLFKQFIYWNKLNFISHNLQQLALKCLRVHLINIWRFNSISQWNNIMTCDSACSKRLLEKNKFYYLMLWLSWIKSSFKWVSIRNFLFNFYLQNIFVSYTIRV